MVLLMRSNFEEFELERCPVSSGEVLDNLGYDYLYVEEERSSPDSSEVTFRDLVPKLGEGPERARRLASERLYSHQLMALNALSEGRNVILISGTGSGKTEAWAIHAIRNRLKVLVIYPTLALSRDQIDRLRSYYTAVGLPEGVVEVDRPKVKVSGYETVRKELSRAYVVVTNPAFLMADLKRVVARGKSVLVEFLREVDLIVIDELDFYGSRRANLLLAMVELLERYVCRKKPQVVVLAATLGNPDELARYLTEINGRKSEKVEGKAFRIPNRIYAILGKNLRKVWEQLRRMRNEVESKVPEVLHVLEDFEKFRLAALDVIEALEGAGIEVPRLELDVVDLLVEYVKREEGYVTVVFTPSIRSAEVLARRLRERLKEEVGEGFDELVAVHHHLVDLDRRRDIEERARRGEVRVVFTVRTLLQGIDIGTIVRVVHYGLPEDVREFKQREGRKGRRFQVPFSETIIVPVKPMDRVLLELGSEGLKEYASLPLEKVFINPSNKYVVLFKALLKLRAGFGSQLTAEEVGLLKDLGLVITRRRLGEVLELSDRGRNVWRYLNFYEFGPPYGVPRKIVGPGDREIPLEEVSLRDFIEKYQPGCFDYSNDAVVVKVDKKSVLEEILREGNLFRVIESWDFLEDAFERYQHEKISWRERPNLLEDLRSGRLTSEVSCYFRVPRRGFGLLVERPESVIWVVESRRRKLVRYGGEVRAVRMVRTIQLRSRVYGRYRDFTYGYTYELDPDDDVVKLRAGLALLKVALRLSDLRVPLHEIEYVVYEVPGKFLTLWESDCCGILEFLKQNLDYVRGVVGGFNPSRIAELLLWAVDEEVAGWLVEGRVTWSEAREYALRVLDYVGEVLRLKLEGVGVVRIPKPSKDLKLMSLDVTVVSIDDREFWAITAFDGEDYHQKVVRGRDEAVHTLLGVLMKALDEEVRVLTYGQVGLLEELARSSRALRVILKSLRGSEAIVDVHREVKELLGVDLAPIEELERYLKLSVHGAQIGERSVNLQELIDSVHRARTDKRYRDTLEAELREYGKSNARSTYLIHLALTSIASPYR